MEFTTGEQTTGVALQDANGTAITLTTQQGEYPRGLTSAGITDVTTDFDAC